MGAIDVQLKKTIQEFLAGETGGMKVMTKDVTEKMKDLNERLSGEKGRVKQSEIVDNALRQLFIRYRGEVSLEEVRKIVKKAIKRSGKSLAEDIETLREEIG
jgi:hypothetical protein